MRYTYVEYPWHQSHGQTQIYVSAIHGHMNDLTPPPSTHLTDIPCTTLPKSELKLLNRELCCILYVFLSICFKLYCVWCIIILPWSNWVWFLHLSSRTKDYTWADTYYRYFIWCLILMFNDLGLINNIRRS